MKFQFKIVKRMRGDKEILGEVCVAIKPKKKKARRRKAAKKKAA